MITGLCQRGAHTYCFDDECECTECHFICPRCHTRVKNLCTGGVCAPCYRAEVAGKPPEPTPCDKCGKTPAFRNPGHRRNEYLCMSCHIEAGESLPLRAVDLGVVADCLGKDISDPLHDPHHVRGHRIMCRKCKCALQVKKPDMEPQTRRQRAGLKGGKR